MKGNVMYAIVKTGGKQYTVKPGDVFDVEKLEGEAGDRIDLDVLFLNDGTNIVTEAGELADTKVVAEIVEQHKGEKKLIFKFKKRKGYKRTKGHRQQLTRIAIVDVNGETAEAPKPKEAPKAEEVVVDEPELVEEAEEQVEAVEAVEDVAAEVEEATEEAAEDLSSMTVAQLKDLAHERDIQIPSGARKAEIIEIIENAQ